MKKIISMFLSVLMIISCVCLNTTVSVYADTVSINYVNAAGVAQDAVECTPITSSTATLGTASTDTWYVANEDATVDSLTVDGNVNLILADGKTLTVTNGIELNASSSLTIYGQTNQSGILDAKSIQMSDALDNATVTINGGNIQISGDINGIFVLTTNINAGKVECEGSSYGVNSSTVNITGGTLITSGSNNGIYADSTLKITGGNITATGGNKAICSNNVDIDSKMTVKSGDDAASAIATVEGTDWGTTLSDKKYVSVFTSLDFTNADVCTAYSTKTNGVQWDDTNKTLTLENVDIDCSSVAVNEFAIKVPDGTTINVVGSNKVKAGHDTDNTRSIGIYGVGDIYFTGSGSLDVTSAAIDISNNSVSTAIMALKNMTIGEDVAIKAKAYSSNTSIGLIVYNGNLTNNGVLITTIDNSASNKNKNISIYVVGNIINNTGAYIIAKAAPTSNEEGTSSYGIYTTGNVSNYGTLATRADVADQSIGLYLSSGSLTNSGAINCVGGENAASVSYGIYVNNNLTNNAGAIIAGTGNKASEYSSGIKVVSGNVYNDGTLNAYGNDSKLSKGLSVDDGDLENYGTIDATSGATTTDSDEKSYGIYVYEDAINTGTITASSGSSVTSTGLFVNDRLENRGEIIGNGGLAKNDSNGVYIGDDITNYAGATITGIGGKAYVSFGVEQLFGDLNNYGTIKGIGGDAEWSSFGVDSDMLIIHSSGLVDVSCDNSATNNDGLSAWYLEMSAGGLVKSTGDVECNISKTLITSSPFEYTNATFECEEVDMGNYKYECLYSPSPAGATLTLYVSAPAYKAPKTCVD